MLSKEKQNIFPVTINNVRELDLVCSRFLGFDNSPETREMRKDIPSSAELDIINNEKSQWKRVLGTEIDVPRIPYIVTPEVQENLKEMGMELRFIPALDLGNLNKLKKLRREKYLKNLQYSYPGWNPYEELKNKEKGDHSVMRNLNKWFWDSVKDRKINFPELQGKWIAVETMPKPKRGDGYEPSIITDILNLKNRFSKTWKYINNTLNNKGAEVLAKIGIKNGELKMLDALEYNLLANREGWGKTNTYEWTSTEFLGEDNFYRAVVVGGSDSGGAANADLCLPENSGCDLGVRFAVEFNLQASATSAKK